MQEFFPARKQFHWPLEKKGTNQGSKDPPSFSYMPVEISTYVLRGRYRHCHYDFVAADLNHLAVHFYLFVGDFDDGFQSEFEAESCPFCFPC